MARRTRNDSAVDHFEARFAALGTKQRAEGSKAYMKSALRFHGVDAKQMRGECVAYCKQRPRTRDEIAADVRALFATDGFDLRSVAIAILERNQKLFDATHLPWLITLARTGACWAHVDYIVTQVIGPILEREKSIAPWLREWARDPDFWIRRVTLLGQLRPLRQGAGEFALFAELAAPMLEEREFFIRKAIGWVLREVSKKRPALVRDFLVEHGPACSGVTWREATKYLPKTMQREVERARAA
jgi:3-methyladenine DNA glycosylase AlkD